jgi:hypothetical protein
LLLASILALLVLISASRHSIICLIVVSWYDAVSLQWHLQSNPTSDTSCHVINVTVDGVWIGSRIYRTPTLYRSLLHTY